MVNVIRILATINSDASYVDSDIIWTNYSEMIKLKNDSRYNEDQIRDNFNGTNGRTGAHLDSEGVVRWNSNNQIPFEDMLHDFRVLDLINEENQLHSNLLREKETDEFWDEYLQGKADHIADSNNKREWE